MTPPNTSHMCARSPEYIRVPYYHLQHLFEIFYLDIQSGLHKNSKLVLSHHDTDNTEIAINITGHHLGFRSITLATKCEMGAYSLCSTPCSSTSVHHNVRPYPYRIGHNLMVSIQCADYGTCNVNQCTLASVHHLWAWYGIIALWWYWRKREW